MFDKNKLDERAIELDDHPEIYLSQRKAVSKKKKIYSQKFAEIIQMLKDLRWQDIRFETSGEYETVILPDPILNAMREAYDIDFTNADRDLKQGGHGFKGSSRRGSSFIQMRVDSSQRSHFPNDGIPNSMRGTGLGYKLYRALLQKHKWIKSNTAGTIEKDYAWASMISPKKDANNNLTEDDVHAIAGPDFVFAMIKTLPTAQKIDLARRFINGISNKDRLTKRNFAVDPELWAILPDEVKSEVDTERRAESTDAKRKARYAKYAPFGLDAHDWELGDYIVLKQYLLDISYNIPVRKVVRFENGQWVAIKIEDIAEYERTGNLPGDIRQTSNKTAWVKSQLQPGQVDPAAGRVPRAGNTQTQAPRTNANDDHLSSAQRLSIRNYLRNDYQVYVRASDWDGRNGRGYQPLASYLVVKAGSGRTTTYSVINARTGEERRGISRTEFDQMELVRLNTEQLQSKANVRQGEFVFVKEHKTLAGYVMMVAYITPASNTRPGVYVKMPRGQRDIHITRPQTLYKATQAATNEWVVGFEDFDSI